MKDNTVTFKNQKFHGRKLKPYQGKRIITAADKIYESKYSAVYKSKKNIYKTVKVQHYIRDNFRILTSRSKCYDEVRGNRFLKRIGVKVPDIRFWGVAPMNRKANELLIIENLEHHLPIEHHTESLRNNGVLTDVLIGIANDINLMTKNGAIYRDLHFQNVLSTLEGDVCWIDTGLKYIRSAHKLNKKLNLKIRVLRKDMFESGLLTGDEWQKFFNHLEYEK